MEECVRRHRDRGVLHFGISSELDLVEEGASTRRSSRRQAALVLQPLLPEDGQRMHSLKVSGDLAEYIRPQPISFDRLAFGGLCSDGVDCIGGIGIWYFGCGTSLQGLDMAVAMEF
jgi:hypothetical protein